MDTRGIYIGEIYNNYFDKNKAKNRKLGWAIIYYDGINYYSVKTGQKIEVDIYKEIYLDINSLISYLSFARTSIFTYREKTPIVINKCLKKIGQLEDQEYRKKYGYNYSIEEIESIHDKNEMTIHEKVNQLLNGDNYKQIIGDNDEYLNRKEYVYKVLHKTGKKSFER